MCREKGVLLEVNKIMYNQFVPSEAADEGLIKIIRKHNFIVEAIRKSVQHPNSDCIPLYDALIQTSRQLFESCLDKEVNPEDVVYFSRELYDNYREVMKELSIGDLFGYEILDEKNPKSRINKKEYQTLSRKITEYQAEVVSLSITHRETIDAAERTFPLISENCKGRLHKSLMDYLDNQNILKKRYQNFLKHEKKKAGLFGMFRKIPSIDDIDTNSV